MGKLILSIYVTLDGLLSGPNGELDFLPESEGTSQAGVAILENAAAILLGGKTYKIFEDYWPTAESDPHTYPPDVAVAKRLNAVPKYVVSESISEVHWNTTIIKNDALAKIRKLKQELAGDIVVFGGARLAQSLMEADLFDEFHIQVVPIILGNGKPLFKADGKRRTLELVSAKSLDGAVVDLHYRTPPQPVAHKG